MSQRSAPLTGVHSRRKRRPAAGTVLVSVLLLVALVVCLFPIYLLVSISLKSPSQLARQPIAPPVPPRWSNYTAAVEASSGAGTASFWQAFGNSLIITCASVLLLVIVGTLGGYFLGRRVSRLSTIVYLGFVAGVIVPVQLVILPIYRAADEFGLLGTRLSVVLLYVGLLTPFAVFLVTSFVRALPVDLEEAALLDGCSPIRMFISVVLPLLSPIVITVVVLTTVAVWNDFFGQLVLLSGSGKETLPITVFSFAGQYSTRYDLLSAGLVITVLPVVLLYGALQRRVIEGFSSGVRG